MQPVERGRSTIQHQSKHSRAGLDKSLRQPLTAQHHHSGQGMGQMVRIPVLQAKAPKHQRTKEPLGALGTLVRNHDRESALKNSIGRSSPPALSALPCSMLPCSMLHHHHYHRHHHPSAPQGRLSRLVCFRGNQISSIIHPAPKDFTAAAATTCCWLDLPDPPSLTHVCFVSCSAFQLPVDNIAC